MTKPFIRKNGDVWTVYIRDRPWNTRATWDDAITHANRITKYAHRIRENREIQRIHDALNRMENNASA